MQLCEVAVTTRAVAALSSRNAKIAALADCLRAADPQELPIVVSWLSGAPRQRRTGLGWAALRDLPPAATQPTLTVLATDAALERAAGLTGQGSASARRAELAALLAGATPAEQHLLAGLIATDLRQGAAAGLVLAAVAAAGGVPADQVRRAVTLSGDLPGVAVSLLVEGPAALGRYRLQVGRPLAPMLAGSATDLSQALDRTGPAGVEWKLDGVRVQIHRDGPDVAVFTRTLDEITSRVPQVVELVRSLPADRTVLDGELIAIRPDSRPAPFQQTSSLVARHDGGAAAAERTGLTLRTWLFDILHADGEDLVDLPGTLRRARLDGLAPPQLRVPRLEITDPADDEQRLQAERFTSDALARGHEGVVVKSSAAGYAMGRRGTGWLKVKPRITLDLVVLAAEWGHGRRTGLLSNLHLGARDPQGRYGPAGGFVMLGKTFKGLTDAMLAWQTERLQQLSVSADRWRVQVRPELVVEVAFDGVQASTRYPAGMALRFARVLAHRPDKPADQADTVDDVRRHAPEG